MVFERNRKIYDTQQNEIIIECSCGTHMIKICSFADEETYWIDFWSSNFYTKQKTPLYRRVWNRLKLIWFAISGKEYRLEDFALTNEDIDNLISALQNIKKSKQEVRK